MKKLLAILFISFLSCNDGDGTPHSHDKFYVYDDGTTSQSLNGSKTLLITLVHFDDNREGDFYLDTWYFHTDSTWAEVPDDNKEKLHIVDRYMDGTIKYQPLRP